MYVGTGKRGRARRVAGAHRLSGLRGLRGYQRVVLGDIDWGSIITTGINQAASVARVAEAPNPTTSIMYPNGAIATATGGAYIPQSVSASLSASSLLSSPILLLGGIALVALVALKK